MVKSQMVFVNLTFTHLKPKVIENIPGVLDGEHFLTDHDGSGLSTYCPGKHTYAPGTYPFQAKDQREAKLV